MKRICHSLLFILCLQFASSCVYARMYGATLCKEEGYHCKRIKSGQSWRSLWPDPEQRDLVMRVNRMNTQLYAGITVAVPNDLEHADLISLSPLPKKIDPQNEKIVIVDPGTDAWAAYASDGTLVRWGPISAGADYCKDVDEPCRTHEGDYRIYSLGSSDCHSRKFPLPDGGAPMPYCMYFHNGQALHGEPNGLPGYNASHGCVRMYVSDAEWLRYSFVEPPNESNEFRGTKVLVSHYGTENPYENRDEDDDSSGNDDHDIAVDVNNTSQDEYY